MNNINWLILAAEYLDKQSNDTAVAPVIGSVATVVGSVTHTFEHGYACALQPPPPKITLGKSYSHNRRKRLTSSRLSGSNRSSHNELEKNRRAHMRHCFDRLKEVVPLEREAARHTTQGLLTKARQLIARIETEFNTNVALIHNLKRDQSFLRERISLSSCRVVQTLGSSVSRASHCRSDSESSGESGGSYSTGSPTFETEQIDVVGEYPEVSCTTTSGSTSVLANRGLKGVTSKRHSTPVNSGKGKRRTRSGGDSGSDADDMRSLASVDSGCGLSPCSKLLTIDGLS